MNREHWFQLFELKKHTEDRLSLIRDKFLSYDYYIVYIKIAESDDFDYLINGYHEGKLNALQYSGDSFSEPVSLDPDELINEQFYVEHWYKGNQFIYYGLDLLAKSNSRDKRRAIISNFKNKIVQERFNRIKLELYGRHTMLEALTDIYFEGDARQPVLTVLLLTRLHSALWLQHPASDALVAKTTFYLDSLVSSGDLKKVNPGSYVPEPKALATLEDYRNSEKKDVREKKDKSWTLFWSALAVIFTLFSAWGTLVQAGILKKYELW